MVLELFLLVAFLIGMIFGVHCLVLLLATHSTRGDAGLVGAFRVLQARVWQGKS